MCSDKKCVNGTISSACVEFDETFTVEKKIESIDLKLISFDKLFNKSVDGKTLATGQDLIKTVQKLVDDSIANKNVFNSTINLPFDYYTIDLSCLTGESCNTVMTQDQIISLLIREICLLKNKLISIPTNY